MSREHVEHVKYSNARLLLILLSLLPTVLSPACAAERFYCQGRGCSFCVKSTPETQCDCVLTRGGLGGTNVHIAVYDCLSFLPHHMSNASDHIFITVARYGFAGVVSFIITRHYYQRIRAQPRLY